MKAADEFFDDFEQQLKKIAPDKAVDFEKVIKKIRTNWQGEYLYISPPSNDSVFESIAKEYIALMCKFSSQLKMPVSKIADLLRKRGRSYKFIDTAHQEYKQFIRVSAVKLQLSIATTKIRLKSIQIPNSPIGISTKNIAQINLLN